MVTIKGASPAQGLPENLDNMSQDELMDYQKKKCIFCNIISGKVQSKKVYEDDKCIAILDINPANPGHVLILPKEHYAILPQMPENIVGHLFVVAKAFSGVILKGLKVGGSTIFVANGVLAGQRAQHFMLHVIPRKESDGLDILNIPQRQVSDSDLLEVQKRVVDKINVLMGVKTETKSKEDVQEKVELKKDVTVEKKEEPLVEKKLDKVEKKKIVEDDDIGLDDIARLLK
jgi:histidine triad (HIT) family protein